MPFRRQAESWIYLCSVSCRDKEFFTSLWHPHRPLYQNCLLFKGCQWLYSGLDVQMTDHLPRLATEFRVSGAVPPPTHKPSSSTTLPFNLSPHSAACKTHYNEGSREIPFMLWVWSNLYCFFPLCICNINIEYQPKNLPFVN
jgi:hypothetical protein